MSINQFMPQPSMVSLPYTPDPYLANVLIGADMEITPVVAGWAIGADLPTTVTNIGSVAVSDLQAKFGEKSLYFPQNNRSMYFGTRAGWNCSTVDWSQEMWVYLTQGGENYFASHSTSADWSEPTIGTTSAGMLRLFFSNANRIVDTVALPVGEWVHIAWGRVTSTGNYYLYKNGILVGNVATGSVGNTWHFTLGAPGWNRNNVFNIKGFIDEFRWWSGVAIRDGINNFTPPSKPWQK